MLIIGLELKGIKPIGEDLNNGALAVVAGTRYP
jgi:hypothetical protein